MTRFCRLAFVTLVALAISLPVQAQQGGTGGRPQGGSPPSGQATGSPATTGTPTGTPTATTGGQQPGGRPAGGRMPIGIAEVGTRSNFVSVAGRLKPSTRTQHLSAAAGYVARILTSEGQRVVEGQGLFTIQRNEVGQTYKPVLVESRVNGVVSEVQIEVNDEVRDGDPGVIVVADNGFVLNAMISDKDAYKVQRGQRVVGHSPEGVEISGVLMARSQEPDYATGLFSLTFEFPAREGIFVGTLLVIELPTDSRDGVFIDRSLVTRRYGKNFAWTVDQDNILAARQVTLGPVFGEDILILSGVSAGDRFLTRLTGRERDGMKLSDLLQRN